MLHILENEHFRCKIESAGAEIRSLVNKLTGQEYIWQIKESIWSGSSPILFPAIGRIKGDKVLHEGTEYAMPKHGIIRNNYQLMFNQLDENSCSFTLTSSAETLKQYPFKFSFIVEYTLVENRLKMSFRIENQDSVPMLFACGGHTAYACSLDENTKLNDYLIEFPSQLDLHTIKLAESKLLSYELSEVGIPNKSLTLTETLFDDDALVFENIQCDWVRLRKKNEVKGIVVRFKGFPNLALWSKPAADYVCIEPWLGLPDRIDESLEITKKTTYQSIKPEEVFSASIETIIEQ